MFEIVVLVVRSADRQMTFSQSVSNHEPSQASNDLVHVNSLRELKKQELW